MSFSRLCRAAAAVLATALLLVLAPARAASADSASDESRVLSLIQQTRSSVGSPALRVDASLTSAARSWAAKMAREGNISHNAGVGSYVSASKLSENVGMGSTIDIVHQGFLNSAGHRANMVDTGVNAVGVGIAWANGYIYIVQDYAKLNSTTPPPNRAPAVPTQLAPGGNAVLRTAPTQVSARYSDPDGTAGRIFFAVVDDKNKIVRQVWSPVVCSGCVAAASYAALPDGFYWFATVGSDGTLNSAVSAPARFVVDRTAPRAPASLRRVAGNAVVGYSDPDGTAGWTYVYVYGPTGALVSQGFSPRVCSGCSANYALPTLGRGTYQLYAIAYDGLLSTAVGPVPFTA